MYGTVVVNTFTSAHWKFPLFLCRMGSALLSRFDLVFILLDTPNEDHDHMLSEHIMAMRAGKKGMISGLTATRGCTQESNLSILEIPSDKPLSDRLKVTYWCAKPFITFVSIWIHS